jgi:hypothetical protein
MLVSWKSFQQKRIFSSSAFAEVKRNARLRFCALLRSTGTPALACGNPLRSILFRFAATGISMHFEIALHPCS